MNADWTNIELGGYFLSVTNRLMLELRNTVSVRIFMFVNVRNLKSEGNQNVKRQWTINIVLYIVLNINYGKNIER